MGITARRQRRWSARRRAGPELRRGVTIVVVLAVISISLALSYAMLRWQGTALAIQQNSRRLSDARSAAVSGMTATLGAMHRGDWQGIDVPLAGTTGAHARYAVTFQVGDPRLQPGDPQFADWPYRVTATCTGYASGSAASGISTHQIRTVLRLQPQRLNTAPQVWPLVSPYTVYHWSGQEFVMQTPARIEGRVYIKGRLALCDAYPSYRQARERYLSDLNQIGTQSGREDYRPFDGPIDWSNEQRWETAWLVTQLLGVTARTFATGNVNDFSMPQNNQYYRLYPGGPEYAIPRLGPVVKNTTLEPDPKSNPLGLFYRDGALELGNHVRITGTVIARESVSIIGNPVQLTAASFRGPGVPATPTRFPALVTLDDVHLSSDCNVRIEGVVMAGDQFHVDDGRETVSAEIHGRVIVGRVQIEGRWPWYLAESTWSTLYDLYRWQLLKSATERIPYFPDFLAAAGLSSKPRITISPVQAEVVDHWQAVDGPVYQPRAPGDGLRWDVIDWVEQPGTAAY